MVEVEGESRRRQLAEALWRLVLRDGIEAASVRKVAAEAGVSAGSLRHQFPSQSELLTFAMELIIEEVKQRIADVEPSGAIREMVERRLRSLLVLDPESRAVFEVWLAFSARARVDTTLRPLRDQTHGQVRDLCRVALETLLAHEKAREDLDLPYETERLHALIDGLAMHATLDPKITTPTRQMEVLSRHLDALA
jgi:AcrR family transcriptional regulator